MKWIVYFFYLCLLVVITTVGYFHFEIKWIYYSKAEKLFKNRQYLTSIDYYLLAIDHGVPIHYALDQLSISCKESDSCNQLCCKFQRMLKKLPSNINKSLDIAQFYQSISDIQDAEIIYIKLITKYPKNTRVRLAYARALASFKEYEKSLTQYEILLEIDPDITKAKTEYARVLVYTRDYEKAEKIYQQIIKKNPKKYNIQIELANLYLLEKKYENALEMLIKIPTHAIDDNTQLLIADLYVLSNQNDSASSIYLSHLKDSPNDSFTRMKYAQALFMQKEYQKANKQYSILLKQYPDNVQLIRKYALLLIKIKKYKEAELKLKQSLRLNTIPSQIIDENHFISDFQARKLLASTYYHQKDKLDLALHDYNTLIEENPNDSSLKFNKAKVLIKLGEYKLAKKELKIFLKDNPENEKALLALGRSYLFSKKYTKAIDLLKKMQKSYHSNDKVLLELARSYAQNRQYGEALEYYTILLERKTSLDILEEISNIYLALDNKTKAIEYLLLAYHENPSDDLERRIGFLYGWDKEYEKALEYLNKYIEKNPLDKVAKIEIAKIYYLSNNQKKSDQIFEDLIKNHPEDNQVISEYGYFQAYLGHFKIAKKILSQTSYKEIVCYNNNIKYADTAQGWGDFILAEKIYKEALSRNENEDILLKLAKLHLSIEGYFKTEQICQLILLKSENNIKALQVLIETYRKEKKYALALEYANRLLEITKKPSAIFLHALCLIETNNYQEAIKQLEELINTRYEEKSLVEIGKIYLLLNEASIAKTYFEKVLEINSQNIEAIFYFNDHKEISFYLKTLSVKDLDKLAQLYQSSRMYNETIEIYSTINKLDPEYSPAYLGLALTYASDQKYDQSLAIINDLIKDFPNNYSLLLWKAKIESWKRNFPTSITYYHKLLKLTDNSPVVLINLARAYSWNDNTPQALKTYNEYLFPSVDSLLIKDLKNNQNLLKITKNLTSDYKTPFTLYENLDAIVKDNTLPQEDQKKIEFILASHLAKYKTQKVFFLESRAKEYFWNKYYIHARKEFKKLIDFDPGNVEALFQYAQTDCILGLYCDSKQTYETLNSYDYFHSLANLAMQRANIKKHPYLQAQNRYYNEEGRGDIDRIKRYRTNFGLDVPIFYDHVVSTNAILWTEKPTFRSITQVVDKDEYSSPHRAKGYAISYAGQISEYFKLTGSFSQKFYDKNRFSSRTMGNCFFNFNANDYFKLILGFNRKNQLDNYFSLQQGIQTDEWSAQITSILKRRLLLDFIARYFNYNDNNNIQFYNLDIACILFDFPTTLKTILHGEYRNSSKQNIFIYDGPILMNIIHPYWTPKDYKQASFHIEFRQNLLKPFFCGNELIYYEIRFSTGNDTESNPYFAIHAALNVDFLNHCSFNIKGYIHRSVLWDSEELLLTFKYQF